MTKLSAQDRGREVTRALWLAFMAELAGILAADDPEALHRGRVAIRRLRTALSSFDEVLPHNLVTTSDELKWLGSQLGDARDADVQYAAVEADHNSGKAHSSLLAALSDERDRAHRIEYNALTSNRFESLAQRVSAGLDKTNAGDPQSLDSFAPDMLRMRHRRFREALRRLNKRPSAERYHAVRRRARQLRFTAEFVEDLYEKPAQKLISALKDAQDLLGELQDQTAAGQLAERLRDSHPDLSDPATELAASHRPPDEILDAVPDTLKKVKKHWKKLKKTL
ncbi:CHAD domain-containing protein [Salinibacterium sp. ZJ454]|uniref:CHAD domain-containing protein n=1 Tax=Salinibacterium sp. ZJ454 TaxID=2708339 RepID=UPI00141F46A3|nr:CHAD domain-containing protein [Salinibacterium sp. ZJ454]